MSVLQGKLNFHVLTYSYVHVDYRNSASCTHVSALLHALAAMTQLEFQLRPHLPTLSLDKEDELPVTSYPCQWKPPKKRKESTLKMAESVFQKHQYDKEKKLIESVEDFDPRPEQYRGKAKDRLPALLDKIHGQGLCISLLFDPRSRCWSTSTDDSSSSSSTEQPSLATLKATVLAFKASLHMTDEEICETERKTRDQRLSSLWFSARQYRLTASNFGVVLHRRDETPPDSLVMRIIQPKQFSSVATRWGIEHESLAIAAYLDYQHNHGHPGLAYAPSGLVISKTHPYLAASPDGALYDSSDSQQPLGYLEVKCPYSQRNKSPADACSSPGFCCLLDSSQHLTLRRNHHYFAQVQGQMAVGQRQWCDFVIYTTKGLSIERIKFDECYWNNTLLPKLEAFYDNCIAPELVSPMHCLGLPLRDLSKM